MEKATSKPVTRKDSKRRRGSLRDKLAITSETRLKASVPPGSRFRGYEDVLVQDLKISVEVMRYRRERLETAAGAFLDPDQHPLAVDIVGFEVRDLRHAQPGAIGYAQRRPVLDTRCRTEQLRHLIDAQHVGELPRTMGQHQPPRQIRPLERHVKQEAQR